MKIPSPEWVIFFCSILFCIGVAGIVLRRNLIIMLMSIELMLTAVNFNLVVLSQLYGTLSGSIVVFFTITIGAAETAVGLALVTALFKKGVRPFADELENLKG